jgi:TPR repeat protein
VIRVFVVAIALCSVVSGVAHAQPSACHALAASPADASRKGAGVSYAKIDGANASAACQLAVKQAPKDGQLWFQYGRALEKNNRAAEAFVAYQTGSDLGNAGADNNLGELYRDGKGVARDLYMAEIYFHNASVSGFDEATQNLNALEKAKPPAATRKIPAHFRGKFALAGQTCAQTQELGKAFGNQFMGIEVTEGSINQAMESQCTVMGLTLANPQQATVVLKCGRNTPVMSFAKATLALNDLRFDASDAKLASVSVRCSN